MYKICITCCQVLCNMQHKQQIAHTAYRIPHTTYHIPHTQHPHITYHIYQMLEILECIIFGKKYSATSVLYILQFVYIYIQEKKPKAHIILSCTQFHQFFSRSIFQKYVISSLHGLIYIDRSISREGFFFSLQNRHDSSHFILGI